MLHKLLRLTRPLIVPDVETTGLDNDARIIEIGFQVWTTEDGLKKEWRTLVNPGIPIPPKTTETHGITDDRMRKCNKCGGNSIDVTAKQDSFCTCDIFHPVPKFSDLASSLAKGFTDVDFAGKNIRFDLRMFGLEFSRAGIAWSYYGARIIDADRLEQLGEPRTLSHLYRKHTGKEPEDAHQALADVRMTTEVIEGQLRAYSMLPRDLDLLHAVQWPGWIDPEGKFKFVDGVPCFSQWGKHAGHQMEFVTRTDRGYWDFILKSNFSSEIKAIAAAAKRGEYPKGA